MTSVLRFSESFWDEQDCGIDILTEKLASSEQTCRDLRNIYEVRAQIEKEYGQRLIKLSHYTLGEVELGTLADSVQRIPKAFESTGKAHIDMAEQLESSLKGPLESFLKEQSELINARTIQIQNSKGLKDMHMAHVEKTKQVYDEYNQLLKQKEQNGEDTESTKYSLAMADREWKNAVENLQDVINKFTLDWRITCDLYQDLEERRINFIRSNLWAFANMMSSVFIVDDRGCESIRSALEMTDVRKDVNDFILKYGTSVKVNNNSSPQLKQNEIINNTNNNTPIISKNDNNDTVTNAFQEVENLLSDSASNERHSIISTTSSIDKYSVHSNQSLKNNNNNNNNNRSSLASIHSSPIDDNKNKMKENVDLWENKSPSSSPPLPITQKETSTKKQPSLKNDIELLTSSDDDDNEVENRLSVRAPKPREEKWMISTRKTKTTSLLPSPKKNSIDVIDPITSKRNSFIPNSNSTTSGMSSSSSFTSLTKKTYLNPTIHPPPLKQSNSSTNLSLPSSQSTILYPPPQQQQQSNNYPSSNTSNNISPVYFIASSSATSLNLDQIQNGLHPTQQQNMTNNHYQTQVYPPSYNQPMSNYPTTTTTYPPNNININNNTYPSNISNLPPTTPYRPIVQSNSSNNLKQQQQLIENHSSSIDTSISTQQQQEIQSFNNRSSLSHELEYNNNNHHLNMDQTVGDHYQPQVNPLYKPPSKNENEQQRNDENIGIRPPKWDNRQEVVDSYVASEYLQSNIDNKNNQMPTKTGLQRGNSVNGPRAPPSKGNFINSSELKNTHGVGEETTAILKEEEEEQNAAISIKDSAIVTETVSNDKPTSSSSSSNQESSTTTKETTTTTTTTTTKPSSSKSGFSFNNIFFKKDKPAAVDDDNRILSDGTTYKHKARAIWSYEARIPSELSFQANDMVAVIRKQPDGWWEAEILDEERKQRGLVPGNFFSLN
ncbi:unnamed protein product [Cunninghamella blakesleeana]